MVMTGGLPVGIFLLVLQEHYDIRSIKRSFFLLCKRIFVSQVVFREQLNNHRILLLGLRYFKQVTG